jgi:chemotaxis protein methyltransferase CheR
VIGVGPLTGPHSSLPRIAKLLEREAGLWWSPGRVDGLTRAIRDHAARLTGGSEDAFADLLQTDAAALDDLISDVTVGETYFFRDPSQFEILRDHVLPDLLSTHGSALRFWSAGCASGEEAYSLAITSAEAGVDSSFPVLGTDISRAALQRAEQARYRAWSFRGVSDETLARYFERDGGLLRPRDTFRARVRFEWLNLTAPAYPAFYAGIAGMHVIFCQNVLIYMTRDAMAVIARKLYDALAPGGWLFTGASDPQLLEYAPFELRSLDDRLFYQRIDGGAMPSVAAWATSPVRWSLPDVAATPEDLATPEHLATPAYAAPLESVAAPAVEAGPGGARAVDDLIAQVQLMANAGRHADAMRLVEDASRVVPDNAELQYLTAVILLERGEHDAAAMAARRACYLDPGLVVASIALGSALRHSGDLRGARGAYRRARAQLAEGNETDLVRLADGERVGGLRRTVDACFLLAQDSV